MKFKFTYLLLFPIALAACSSEGSANNSATLNDTTTITMSEESVIEMEGATSDVGTGLESLEHSVEEKSNKIDSLLNSL